MPIYTVHKAKTHFSRLIKEVEAGEEVLIARGATPVARLVPVVPRTARTPGALAGRLVIPDDFWDPLPDEELDAWEA